MNRRENMTATLACGLAGEVIRTFGEVRLRVFGTSMVPSILPGDLISVQQTNISKISGSEIVLYSRDGRLFVHRVVGCAGDADEKLLVTRGDRLRYNDPPISSSELLGRVTFIKRYGRKVSIPCGPNHPLLPMFQTSDWATYFYVRLASLWGMLVGRTFRSDNPIGPEEGLLSPEASGAKARLSSSIKVGAKAPAHKPDEFCDAVLQTDDAGEALECRA